MNPKNKTASVDNINYHQLLLQNPIQSNLAVLSSGVFQ